MTWPAGILSSLTLSWARKRQAAFVLAQSWTAVGSDRPGRSPRAARIAPSRLFSRASPSPPPAVSRSTPPTMPTPAPSPVPDKASRPRRPHQPKNTAAGTCGQRSAQPGDCVELGFGRMSTERLPPDAWRIGSYGPAAGPGRSAGAAGFANPAGRHRGGEAGTGRGPRRVGGPGPHLPRARLLPGAPPPRTSRPRGGRWRSRQSMPRRADPPAFPGRGSDRPTRSGLGRQMAVR